MKLPESVEWLERNYDSFVYEVGPPRMETEGLDVTYWNASSQSWAVGTFNQYEMGRGSGHRQPMFNFRAMETWDDYTWMRHDFVPLSRESDANAIPRLAHGEVFVPMLEDFLSLGEPDGV